MVALKPECFSFISQQLELERRRPALISSGAEEMLKDTSIRLTITLQVSMLKPSVFMSVPEKKKQEGEQVSR